MEPRQRLLVARLVAPLAFLMLATLGVVAVRSALHDTTSTPAGTVTSTTSGTAGTTKPAPAATKTNKAKKPAGKYYRVQAGDTLETIAAANGTTVDQLLQLNPGVDPVALRIGQRIRVG